jgi:hypothetical protein
MAVATQPPPTDRLAHHLSSCPNCGYSLPAPAPTGPSADDTQAALLEAQRRIADLEAQVQLLNQKASAAVDRWADYEDELSRIRASASQLQSPTTPATSVAQSVASPTTSSFLPAGAANRISALLSPRKSTPNLRRRTPSPTAISTNAAAHFPPALPQSASALSAPTQGPLSPTPSSATTTAEDLMEALSREQNLRLAAESRLSTTSKEVEELSVALFEQANEMVATERRARARLEERVEVLERRDVDKRRRLDRLEQAMTRIQRVRSLLGEDATAAAATVVRSASTGGAEAGEPKGVEEKKSW